MKIQYKKFFEKISSAKSVLLLTHKFSDIDAVSSCLLMKELLKTNFNISSDIQIEYPSYRGIDRMYKYYPQYFNDEELNYVKSIDQINFEKYDTVVILDANGLTRVFSGEIKVDLLDKEIIIIDHHQVKPETNTLYINEHCASTTEQIFSLFEQLKNVKISLKANHLTQFGILADTQNFIYIQTTNKTLNIYQKLTKESKITNEEIIKALYGTTIKGQEVTKDLIENLKFNGKCGYSFVSEEITETSTYKQEDVSYSLYSFVDRYLYFIEEIDWGFVIHNVTSDSSQKRFSVSFRSLNGKVKVLDLALKFNGGGHFYGAGTVMYGSSQDEIIEQILEEAKQQKML
jgi:nanoRNase/pAp phosphatase (c-di-AMP/oligoRNAs hydrolase)